MTRFIWVRDKESREHYINVKHIVRVTKVPASRFSKTEPYAYIVLNEGHMSQKTIDLSKDDYDTVEDVINKISVAMA